MVEPAETTPPTYPTAPCSSCAALIVWAVTASTGRAMPVDAAPADDGNVKLTARDGQPPLAVVVGNPAKMFGVRWKYRSHFATCPNAAKHRRPR